MFKEKIMPIIYCLAFIFFSIPRSIETVLPNVYKVVNLVKLILMICIYLLYFYKLFKLKDIKVPKIILILLCYFMYLFIITVINGHSVFLLLKVYSSNLMVFLLLQLVYENKEKFKLLNFFSRYLSVLLIVNFLGIVIGYIIGNEEGKLLGTYLLGIDNRIILYSLLGLLITYYLYSNRYNTKEEKVRLYVIYFVSLTSLISIWSLTSFIILIIIGLGCLLIKIFNKIHFNVYVICTMLTVICILIVFFNITSCFTSLIVNVLHKSETLSYRTILWSRVTDIISKHPINLIFGFGYFDVTGLIQGFNLNHFHNYILDLVFPGGIVGICIYFTMINQILKRMHINKKIACYKNLTVIFVSIVLMLIFDTFQMFPIYYMILYTLYKFEVVDSGKEEVNIIGK